MASLAAKRASDWRKAALWSLATLFVVAGLAYLFSKKGEFAVGTDLCPINRPISGHTIFVVDRSDPLGTEAMARLVDRLKTEASHLLQFERLSIYALDNQASALPRMVFSRCNPGSRNASNPAVQTPVRLQKRFDSEFLAPMMATIQSLDPKHSTPESPLINLMLLVPTLKDFGPGLTRKRLILFSDMVEHTRHYSQANPSIGGFTTANYLNGSAVMKRLHPQGIRLQYGDTDVIVYQLAPADKQAGSRMDAQHAEFWRVLVEDILKARSYRREPA